MCDLNYVALSHERFQCRNLPGSAETISDLKGLHISAASLTIKANHLLTNGILLPSGKIMSGTLSSNLAIVETEWVGG